MLFRSSGLNIHQSGAELVIMKPAGEDVLLHTMKRGSGGECVSVLVCECVCVSVCLCVCVSPAVVQQQSADSLTSV